MKKKLLIFLVTVLSIFYITENTFSDNCDQKIDTFCVKSKTISEIKWISWENSFDNIVMNWIDILLWFLFIIALIYWLYWAWNIFSSLDDDEKVKKWKTIILRACLWLVVIFLSYPITNFVIKQFLFEEWRTTSSANP